LLLLRSELCNDGSEQTHTEAEDRRDVVLHDLIREDERLHRGPVLAAPLNRPAGGSVATLGECLVASNVLLTRRATARGDDLLDVFGIFVLKEGPHFSAECFLLRGVYQRHC